MGGWVVEVRMSCMPSSTHQPSKSLQRYFLPIPMGLCSWVMCVWAHMYPVPYNGEPDLLQGLPGLAYAHVFARWWYSLIDWMMLIYVDCDCVIYMQIVTMWVWRCLIPEFSTFIIKIACKTDIGFNDRQMLFPFLSWNSGLCEIDVEILIFEGRNIFKSGHIIRWGIHFIYYEGLW